MFKPLTRTLTLAAIVPLTATAFAQMSMSNDPKKMPSPPAVAETKLDGKAVTIHYNAPSLRGRVMIGEHDPYGKVWRLGANPATSLKTETDLTIGTLKVPVGSYTLYALPEAPGKPWLLIVNKQTGQWGTEYDQTKDLGRIPMQSNTLPASQETMSLTFENVHGKQAELHVRWARADEFVTVTAK